MPPFIRGNSLYTVVEGPTWSQAEANSVKLGGHLVSIQDEDENKFLTDVFVNTQGDYLRNEGNHLWIGGTDSGSEGTWRWSDGSSWIYSNWLSGQPDNSLGKEDFATFLHNGRGKWNDARDTYYTEQIPGSRIDGIAEIPLIRRGDSAYVIVQGPTWNDAEANAVKLGGHLVTINDAEENRWLHDTFKLNPFWDRTSDLELFGGLYLDKPTSQWRWISGEPVTFTQWSYGEPSGGPGEAYLALGWSDHYSWNDTYANPVTPERKLPSAWPYPLDMYRGLAEIKLSSAPPAPTYLLTPSSPSINEGSTLATTVSTTNVNAGTTLYYSLTGTGINAADFSSGSLTGSGSVGSDGKFQINHLIANDLTTEGDETLFIKLFSDSARTKEVASTSVLIKDSVTSFSADLSRYTLIAHQSNKGGMFDGDSDLLPSYTYGFYTANPGPDTPDFKIAFTPEKDAKILFVTGDKSLWALADYSKLRNLIDARSADFSPNIDFTIFDSASGTYSSAKGNVLSRYGAIEDPWISISGGHYDGIRDGRIVWGENNYNGSHTQLKNAQGGLNVYLSGSSPELSNTLFSIGDLEIAEGGSGNDLLTINRSGDTSAAQTVAIASKDGSAKAGSDYEAISTSVNFAPGVTTQRIRVRSLDDTVYEGDESFSIVGGAITGGPSTLRSSWSKDTGTVTIKDNDPLVVPNRPAIGSPAIDGKVIRDAVITANTSGISDADGLGSFSYRWSLKDAKGSWIELGTAKELKLTNDMVNKSLKLNVSFTDGKGNLESLTSSEVTVRGVDPDILKTMTASDWEMYVDRYPLTLGTIWKNQINPSTGQSKAAFGESHYLANGDREGRVLKPGLGSDLNDYGAYVENYGTTLLDVYRSGTAATNPYGDKRSLFEWGKWHYDNFGKAEGRQIAGGVDWGAIVRNDSTLLSQFTDAQRIKPSLTAFQWGYDNQSSIKGALGIAIGTDLADTLSAQRTFGLGGDDTLIGTTANDILHGGFGNDAITGGGGKDLVYGGPGDDVFQLAPGSNLNIRDFRKGADLIQLTAGLSKAGVTMEEDFGSGIPSAVFVETSSGKTLGSVYGMRPGDLTYALVSKGVSSVWG